AAEQIIGIEDGESARAFRERREDLLIRGRGWRERRNNHARLGVDRIVGVEGDVATAGGSATTSSATRIPGPAGSRLPAPARARPTLTRAAGSGTARATAPPSTPTRPASRPRATPTRTTASPSSAGASTPATGTLA